jgi:hypothetical protein
VILALALFAFSFAIRALYVALRGPQLFPDSATYSLAAANLANHGHFSVATRAPFAPSTRIPPLYATFLWLLHYPVSTSARVVVLLQGAFDAAISALLFLVVSEELSITLGLAVAIAHALSPDMVMTSDNVLTEPLFTSLQCCGVLLFWWSLRIDRARYSAAAGFVLALTTLCRSLSLLLPFALIAAALTLPLPAPRTRQRHLIALFAAFAVTLLPWTIRTSRLAHARVPVQSGGGVNFYATTQIDVPASEQWSALRADDPCVASLARAATPPDLVESDRVCTHLAVARIAQRPFAYVVSRLVALPHLFVPAWSRGALPTIVKQLVMYGFALVPLALAVLGAWSTRRHPLARLATTVWLYTIVMHLALWVDSRFWSPVYPFVLVSAAYAVDVILKSWRATRSSSDGP